MVSSAPVYGSCSPRFEPVASAIERIATAEPHAACAVAAYVHGRPTIDVWAGLAARQDSLFHTWSTVKPLIGTSLLLLLRRSRIPVETPVAFFWPELHAARSSDVTLRHVLAHAIGLVSVPYTADASALTNWDATIKRLTVATPDWEPGTGVGEHALTYGHLVGELIRRLDGRTPGAFLAEELADPLGLDVHVGVDPSRQHRILDTVDLDTTYWERHRANGPALRRNALGSGVTATLVNSSAWRAAQVPAVNGHATARGLAAFYARLLEGALPSEAAAFGASGTDRVLGRYIVWTLSGGQLRGGRVAMGGVGGQLAEGDPDTGLAWAFLTNAMGDGGRAAAVENALYSCLTPGHASARRRAMTTDGAIRCPK